MNNFIQNHLNDHPIEMVIITLHSTLNLQNNNKKYIFFSFSDHLYIGFRYLLLMNMKLKR